MDMIKDLRKIIDEIDDQMLDLIKSRMEVVVEIGEAKKQNKINVVDQKREEEIYSRLVNKARAKGVKPEIVKKVWKALLEISYEIETSSEPHKGSVGEGGKNGGN